MYKKTSCMMFASLLIFTLSSCSIFSEIFAPSDSSSSQAAPQRTQQSSSSRKLPNQASRAQNSNQVTRSANLQTNNTSSPTNNTPSPTNNSQQSPSAQNSNNTETIASPSQVSQKAQRSKSLLPNNAKVVCYSYSNICDNPPEGKVINTHSDDYFIIFNDDNLISPWDSGSQDTNGLKISFKRKHDVYYKTYIHYALDGGGGTSEHHSYSYQLEKVEYNIEDSILSYLILMTDNASYNLYDDDDNVIGSKDVVTKYGIVVIIDTTVDAMIAEYTAFWADSRGKRVKCDFSSDNTNWIYKCDNAAPVVQPMSNGGFYQSELGERWSVSTTVMDCLKHSVEDKFKSCVIR